ncbi:cystathione beta-lyase [Amphibacillus marinus]|uniref:cysteine-S-conjugate beta-lyase n=1 Tax=Amphibacillus marinus TaxID=872970 RepID=A0A1H8S094_9BACI|nr:MalY/PatB family protein [Amphibacillus marinus]SEO72111.1 cystathione beta-lyase [Amphibacillus marinus]
MVNLFEQLPNRKGTRSVKWDMVKQIYGAHDVQPMWVADMDLEIAQPIKEALKKVIDHGVFGYSYTDDKTDNSIKKWLLTKHDWEINSTSLLYSAGVLEIIHMTVLTYTKPKDKILIQTPVYHPFQSIIKNHQRELVTNSLLLNNGHYTIDFEDLELKFRTGVKLFIFCSPHNPVGRVWKTDELTRVAELAHKYNVMLISDEIHADLVYPGVKHIPIGSLDTPIKNKIITCMAPTKTFNLAGLQVAYAIIPDKTIRTTIYQAFETHGRTMLNTLGITALEAAYEHGFNWLAQLIELLVENLRIVNETFKNRDEVNVIQPEGTYLIWLDFRKSGLTHKQLTLFMQEEAKIGLNSGATFGDEGKGFMRMNIASPTSYVLEGVEKICQALDRIKTPQL